MKVKEFVAAAKKGQGRAIVALRDGKVKPSLKTMSRLVLGWPGHDAQLEESREWYCAELIRLSGYEAELTARLAELLGKKGGRKWDRWHQAYLAGELARRGSVQIQDAMLRNYDPKDDFRFAEEIVSFGGLEGLKWVVLHSSEFLTQENGWEFDQWIEEANETVGEVPVSTWLREQSDPVIKQFASLLNDRPSGVYKPPPKPSPPFEEFRRAWMAKEIRSSPAIWVLNATDEDLALAWRDFETADDPQWLQHLANGLRHCKKDCNIDVLIELARKPYEPYRPYVTALEEVEDPRVRQLAVDLIASGRTCEGLILLRRNCQQGDESFVLEVADKLTDSYDRHDAGTSARDIGERLKSSELLIWVYEQTPCSFCRNIALTALIEMGSASADILKEALLDCVEDSRLNAADALAQQGSND